MSSRRSQTTPQCLYWLLTTGTFNGMVCHKLRYNIEFSFWPLIVIHSFYVTLVRDIMRLYHKCIPYWTSSFFLIKALQHELFWFCFILIYEALRSAFACNTHAVSLVFLVKTRTTCYHSTDCVSFAFVLFATSLLRLFRTLSSFSAACCWHWKCPSESHKMTAPYAPCKWVFTNKCSHGLSPTMSVCVVLRGDMGEREVHEKGKHRITVNVSPNYMSFFEQRRAKSD